MTTSDILHETFSALTANKVRTSLTMLGIIIGISSVITMVSIGQGAQSAIQSSIQSIGSNLIIISPGATRSFGYSASTGRGTAKTLTMKDVDAIANEIENINAVSPEISSRYQITAKGTNTNTSVIGSEPAYVGVHNITIEEGTFISSQDNTNRSKVAVIGPTVRDDLFGAEAQAVGQSIRINGMEFKVIGAKRHDINVQFLTEAVALTLIGGTIGVILGWSASYIVTSLGILETQISLTSVLLAFGVSALIGIVFGYYPARRASRLNPIEALRYE